MADFNSNFNDIQKQIAVADLTDEQIQELVATLQTRRSARPELTKEERVFFQCCRERRSYANNKDLDTVVCPHCGSVKVVKYGKSKGKQRYRCKGCDRTFGDTNGTVAFRSKLSVSQWIEFIKLTLQGESCRTIAKELGIKPIAKMVSFGVAGCDATMMGLGPIYAVPKALKRAGKTIDDMDVIELNEAFAAQAIPCIKVLKMNPEKVNPYGGAMALGHPMGATGAFLTCKTLDYLQDNKKTTALVTMCIGGGMGAAAVFELL